MTAEQGNTTPATERPLRDAIGVVLAALALACMSAFAARLLVADAAPWFGNGLLLGFAMRKPRSARFALPVAVLLGAAMRGLAGVPWPLAGALAGADGLELALAWSVLHALRRRAIDAPERPLGVGLAISALLATLPAAAVAAVATHVLAQGTPLPVATDWWLGHAFGLLAIAPLALATNSGSHSPRQGVLAGGVLLALCVGVLSARVPAIVLLLAPLLLWAATRLPAASVAIIACVADIATFVAAVVMPGHVLVAAWPSPALQAGLAAALVALAPVVLALLRDARDAAQAHARQADMRLHAVLAHAPTLIAHLGRDMRHRAVNRAYVQWLGREEDAVIGKRVHEVLDEAGASRLASRLQRVLAGQAQSFELVLGDGRALRIEAVPEHAPEGGIDGACVMAEDLGWRRDAALQFEALLSAADPLLLVDDAGRITQANAAAAALFGMDRELLLETTAQQWWLGAARDTFADLLALARRNDDMELVPVATALEARHSDGSRVLLDVRCNPVPVVASRTMVAVALRDASERHHLAHSLHRQQSLADATLQAVADGVIVCDATRNITGFNPIAEELTGWSQADALGQPVQNVVRLRASEGDAPQPLPLEVAIAGNREAAAHEATLLVRRDGTRVPVQASAQPIHDAGGIVSGGLMVFRQVNEVRAMAQKMSHLAQHDYLTDLPNRVLLQDRLSQALATIDRGAKGALLFLDLDFFKQINDSIGHHAGDHVLKEIARRLKENVRADDTVSRQGGDEFVLLLVRLADPRDAARVAEKLIQSIEQPIPFEGQDLRVSASIGIALFPQDARDTQTLMKQADTALYHAKEAGRGRYSYFTGIMSAKAEQRMRVEHDLRFALANQDFFLAYQPKVTLPDGRITGMEALVRWRRCDTGEVVPPTEFIPVAEETGLITALDEWVMREACRQNKAWQDAGLPAVPVSVNVSLARFDPDRLLAHVGEVLSSTGLAAQWLEIEFTESEMFKHMERAQTLIAQLKTLGVQVAIDDFGTGYSGLSYLMRYRFDVLKIDRSFVQGLPDDPRNTAIVQAIVAMARALDYRVVAEGVETYAQADSLRGYGCHEMQGFLYGRPVPAAEFGPLLRRGAIATTDYDALPRSA